MTLVAERLPTTATPEAVAAAFRGEPGLQLLRGGQPDLPQARFSYLAARPFLTFRADGSRCELRPTLGHPSVQYGNPWSLLESLLARYEVLESADPPLPLGAALGFFGYDLRRHLEPRLAHGVPPDLPVPDLWLAFYDSLLAFDHLTQETWILSTGMLPDGSRHPGHARQAADRWRHILQCASQAPPPSPPPSTPTHLRHHSIPSNFTRTTFTSAVQQALQFIRSGDIYQVNLAQRFGPVPVPDPWEFWTTLYQRSPAPCAAFLDAGDFQIASVSPELFLRLHDRNIVTRPIKGTRPRSSNPQEDLRLAQELESSPKELAELLMITDLLRNDLGRVCSYGSVTVPDLRRLERFAQVQHLVSTVQGLLRPGLTHVAALAACFPGGSITGAPKIRAMEIIDQLEPVARGPYTGCAGFLGFNRRSELNILIRTAVISQGQAWYHAGAGIVADSHPDAEYDETLDKAQPFFAALDTAVTSPDLPQPQPQSQPIPAPV
jgi:para-aminobenzoate synthetase component 1